MNRCYLQCVLLGPPIAGHYFGRSKQQSTCIRVARSIIADHARSSTCFVTALSPVALQQAIQVLPLLSQQVPAAFQACDRVRICVLLEQGIPLQGALEQVKQIRWNELHGVMVRLPDLEEVAVVIVDGEADSEIWQEVYRQLRPGMLAGVSLVQSYNYIL